MFKEFVTYVHHVAHKFCMARPLVVARGVSVCLGPQDWTIINELCLPDCLSPHCKELYFGQYYILYSDLYTTLRVPD